ncbi:MAG TPA: AgmX/PglI C-terminal domain-containing protein [Myxococcota bacterium]|nr:AgmX/PglI C-terminal domain-containing protein [Myxococcota bacterium]
MANDTCYLRCALVWERTVLEERLFGPGSRVSVGESPAATFTLRGQSTGKRLTVFRQTSRGTLLWLLPGMRGRVRIAGVTREVSDLLNNESYEEHDGGGIRFNLGEGDGGVLVFGRAGLKFDTVVQKLKAPAASLRQIVGYDSFTNKIFGIMLAMVLMFSLVSRLFAGSTPGYTVEQLPDRLASFVVDDPETVREFNQEIKRAQQEERKKQQQEQEDTRKAKHERRKKSEPAKNEPPLDRETQKMRKKVASKGVVGALSIARKKGALHDVMGKGGLGMSLNAAVRNLDRGAASARLLTSTGSTGIALPGLVARRGSAEAIGEGIDEARPHTGSSGRRAGRTSRLASRSEAQVSLAMPSSAARVTGGELSRKEIYTVVSRNKGAIRYCYESQLMRYPTLRGQVTVDFIIDIDGSVKSVGIKKSSLTQATARSNVSRCLMKFIKRWHFPKPRGGKVRVIYPFTFGRK